MYYDDGYEELKKLEEEEASLEYKNVPQTHARAYRMSNGDIFTVCNVTVKFVDNVLYEVVEDGEDVLQAEVEGINYRLAQTKWKLTGKTYTVDQLNELIFETKGE